MDKFVFLSVGDTPALPTNTPVNVYTDAAGTIEATIYQDDGVTPITQPLLVDPNGEFSFRANNGTYWMKIDSEPLVEFRMFDGTGLSWNSGDHTFDIQTGLGGVVLQVGQEDLLIAYNNTGVAIPDFTPVSLDGSSGTRPLIYVTDFTNATAVRCFIGVTTMAIPHGEHGFVNRGGFVRDVDTNSYNESDRLWGAGTGLKTSTEPTSGYKVLLGMVIKKSAGNGIFYSNPRVFQTANDTFRTTTTLVTSANLGDAVNEIASSVKSFGVSGAVTLDETWTGRCADWTGTGNANFILPNSTTKPNMVAGMFGVVQNCDSADTLTVVEDYGITVVYATGAAGGRKLAPGADLTWRCISPNNYRVCGRLTP